jgi:hypothetical protein
MTGGIARVEVAEASAAERVLIRNVYPLYLHDLSPYTDFYDLDERGVFFPDYLPDWLDHLSPLVHPLIIRADGRPAGFAFVGQAPFPHMTAGRDYRISEFFVLARYRRPRHLRPLPRRLGGHRAARQRARGALLAQRHRRLHRRAVRGLHREGRHRPGLRQQRAVAR